MWTRLITAFAVALCMSAAMEMEELLNKNQCRKSVSNFSTAHSLMITCILENAEPSRFCQKCNAPKQLMVSKYKFLLENATDESGKVPCRSIYIDSHLHFIEDLYTSTMAVWNNAFCDDCWNAGATNLSDTAQIFFDDSNDFQQCTKAHKDDVCIKCQSRYAKLSKYYDTIRQAKANQICFDITDTVNKTRKSWSLDFKCCNDKSNDLSAFFSMAGVVGAMPLIFYLTMFFYTRRTESNSEDLLSDQVETNGPSTSSGVRPATTREANESDLKQRHSGSSDEALEGGPSTSSALISF